MNTPIDDGGPAFPIPCPKMTIEGQSVKETQGMTLRDWLASEASEEDILLNVPSTCGELAKQLKINLHELSNEHTLQARCQARYKYADAMIAVRKETK